MYSSTYLSTKSVQGKISLDNFEKHNNRDT